MIRLNLYIQYIIIDKQVCLIRIRNDRMSLMMKRTVD